MGARRCSRAEHLLGDLVRGERDGMEFLQRGREIRVQQRVLVTVAMMDIRIAEVMAEAGDVDLGIEKARSILETLIESEDKFIRGRATVTL